MQVAALKVSSVSGVGRSRKDLSKALSSVLRFLNLTGKRSRTRDFSGFSSIQLMQWGDENSPNRVKFAATTWLFAKFQ
jgi:hypothetical protein